VVEEERDQPRRQPVQQERLPQAAALDAVFGTLGGVILGTFLGWAVVRSSGSASLAVFAAPPLQLVLFLVLGAVTGILAGVRPARRAARLNMISAIAAG
jgi:putative ABC transport system permease protein